MLDASARLLRLLTALQSRPHWAGPDLAERLEVTTRTLRRDVEKLRSLGYAIESDTGPGGGYRLGAGRALPPLMLDDDEAVAVAVALRAAADGFTGIGETLVGVLVKVSQLFPERLRRRVSALQAVTVSVGSESHVDPDVLTAVAVACRDHERLRFAYVAHDGTRSERHVEPLRLAHTGNRRWYLVAFDVEREAWRTFRVDRIQAEPTRAGRFHPREPPADLEAYVAESIAAAPYRYRARFRVPLSAEACSARIPPWIGLVEALGESAAILTVGADSVEALLSQVMLAGVDFELLEPPALRPALLAVAERIALGAGAAHPGS